jgi:hypothetical protein
LASLSSWDKFWSWNVRKKQNRGRQGARGECLSIARHPENAADWLREIFPHIPEQVEHRNE